MGDASGLAHAIRALQQNASLREQLGVNARNAFLSFYTREQSAAAWCRLLASLPQRH